MKVKYVCEEGKKEREKNTRKTISKSARLIGKEDDRADVNARADA
jgi:hypothetical protein